ncbi:unnamed protein product, partial [Laminaria digitata]
LSVTSEGKTRRKNRGDPHHSTIPPLHHSIFTSFHASIGAMLLRHALSFCFYRLLSLCLCLCFRPSSTSLPPSPAPSLLSSNIPLSHKLEIGYRTLSLSVTSEGKTRRKNRGDPHHSTIPPLH